jgi:uncharacterized protein
MPTDIPLGAPIWVDSNTTDYDRDVAFYSALFGWKPLDGGEEWGHYTELRLGDSAEEGRAIGGIVPNLPEDPDAQPRWTVAFHVADCAATAAEAEKHGGSIIMQPTPIGDNLVFAMAADPDGAMFGLFEPKTDDLGFKAYGEPRAACWFEYGTTGVPAETMRFYADLLGWEVSTPPWEAPDNPRPYAALSAKGAPIEFGGCHAAEENEPPHTWATMFLVDDTDAAAAQATELGGTVVGPPQDVPGTRIAGIAAPSGAVFGIMDDRT